MMMTSIWVTDTWRYDPLDMSMSALRFTFTFGLFLLRGGKISIAECKAVWVTVLFASKTAIYNTR